jgi:hypothetical protein
VLFIAGLVMALVSAIVYEILPPAAPEAPVEPAIHRSA